MLPHLSCFAMPLAFASSDPSRLLHVREETFVEPTVPSGRTTWKVSNYFYETPCVNVDRDVHW